ncbi:MAG: AAA family ATPase [Endomicrobiales bacterium]|nr:AAA family ATPase [Endomicrobiales bacterium]
MYRKLKVFWINHWLKLTIVVVCVSLIILTVVGLGMLESFYRNLTLATIPLQLLLTGINAMVFVYFYMAIFRGGLGGLKKSKIKTDDVKVRFRDVIGLEGAKKEAMEIVQLLKDRAYVKKIGGKVIKGLLLVGPPGCGKTLLARAIATESNIPFISISGSEFVEIFVGVGASRVRKLFKKARQYAYAEGACILFIDELEVIGRGRTFSFMGGGEETNSTQNQLLVEMDGLESGKHNIIVVGATNAAEGIIDKALLRPGRFDRKIYISHPNLGEREDLFKYYLKKVKYNPSMDVSRLAKKTVYKSPADIQNIIKEAALIATRKKREHIEMEDLSEAMDRIDLGLETHILMTPQEKEQTAYHEAGHAVALYFLHPTDDVFKATIKSRGPALGMVSHHPREELHTHSREKLLADIKVSLAGYVAEKIKYGTTSTGVSSDFQKATKIAHVMVWELGMGQELIGDFSAVPDNEISNSLKEKLNNETIAIMNDCHAKVTEFLKAKWNLVDDLARELIDKNELDFDTIDAIFKREGKPLDEAAKKFIEPDQNSADSQGQNI